VRDVIDVFCPLLIGLLSGNPVPCARTHKTPEPAWTLTVSGLPVCQEHLETDQ
jgi:hypothetical protein